MAKKTKSKPFDMEELNKVLKSLKTEKSKDHCGYICELFKEGVIGLDLKESILMMMNKVKEKNTVPQCFRMANVTILHKKKCRLDLKNWRGIFVCSVLRTILMKLIYERTYEKVDKSMTDSQIGARKNKSVRNHLFIINSIMSDVLSSVKKEAVDLNIMDFKQMFDAEDLITSLNSMYEAGVTDDMLSLIYEANKVTYFAVKTPNGLTEVSKIENKVLQGDVLAPLISSNMVDKHIGLPAMSSDNVYLYKNKVLITPLTMQDDTMGISVCGYKSRKMNNFMNTRTNLMSLQFGRDKCEKMHIGKKRNMDLCAEFEVDAWEEEIVTNEQGEHELVDTYVGKENMKTVSEKKYLGDIIQNYGKNTKNIKAKTDKGVGNVNKIVSSLHERPYGKHTYKAALLMRQGMLVGSMLTNAEAWINITEKDIENLTTPDTILQREILVTSGNPAKVFMYLELGITPVKFVIKAKRLNFLNYILKEHTDSMLRQTFDVLSIDSRKGDFVALVKKDMQDLEIEISEEEIKSYSKYSWKKFVKRKVREFAFNTLKSQNLKLENTKEIFYEDFKLRKYLSECRSVVLAKIIFAVRSKSFDIKLWQPWKYHDNLCVICELKEESMDHFMTCQEYENMTQENNWKIICGDNVEYQYEIAKIIKQRQSYRSHVIEKYEAGQADYSGSGAPGDCRAV